MFSKSYLPWLDYTGVLPRVQERAIIRTVDSYLGRVKRIIATFSCAMSTFRMARRDVPTFLIAGVTAIATTVVTLYRVLWVGLVLRNIHFAPPVSSERIFASILPKI